ncbi:MAG TPA: hypothetical protein VNT79_06945, partial [Phycisphaerae bacterium]|nr:hypothetical protein [Phycisphaerae bacterium]
KGIPLNPNNAQLYRELAWILFHKVGDFMDDWHFYYKNQFALQMEDILGEPPAGFIIPGRPRDDFYRDYDYKSLAAMPERYDQFIEDEKVAAFAERLEEFGFEPSDGKAYLGLLKSIRENKLAMPATPAHLQEDRRQAFLKFFNDPENAGARDGLETFWRAYRLRNEVKLDPQRIVELQQGFGVTLDFRIAESHSLYWANLGLEMGTDRREAIDIHKLNTNRIEFYCLQKMFHRGRLTMSRMAQLGQPPILEPDIRVIPSLFRAFINDSENYRDLEVNPDQKVSENFRTGFVGFMRAAILAYHERDMDREANELFTYLKNSFPDPMYEDGIGTFLAKQMIPDKELGDYRVTYRRMESLIVKGLENYAYDEDDQAVRYLGRAKQLYDHYQKTIVSERMGLQASFDEIVRNIAHVIGGRMPREIYVYLCGKLKIEPLPAATETQPATMPG